jgi:hypothetical protein
VTHNPWEILGDGEPVAHNRHEPLEWLSLDTPEREATTWKDWRQGFLDRFQQLALLINRNRASYE